MQKMENDVSHLADHARALMAATADVAGDHVKEVRDRLAAALDSGKSFTSRLRDEAASRGRACDEALHQNPYQAIGIAIGLGALLGYLVMGGCPANRR
jgi:ElaB/YqjD/DUF883 family membrane-anchored ribosome-binding protein